VFDGYEWQWQGGSGCGSVAVWQWHGSGWVAVDGWQWGGVAGEKMEGIGPVLREVRVFGAWVAVGVAVAKVAVTSAVAVDGWQWQGGSGSVLVAVTGCGRRKLEGIG
jgi:hypothetical protein